MRACIVVLVLVFATACHSFQVGRHSGTGVSLKLTMKNDNSMVNQITKAITSGLVATSFLSGPMLVVTSSPPVAHADIRAQQKRTYFRYIPKLVTGRDFYKNELKTAIDKEDWAVVTKMFDEFVSRRNPDSGAVESMDTYVAEYFYRPMTVFSGSFAERGSSDKQRALLAQEAAFEAAMTVLDNAVNDKKGGFFGGEVKAPTGAARKNLAVQAYADGKAALNEYIRIANEGLMRELNKIDQM